MRFQRRGEGRAFFISEKSLCPMAKVCFAEVFSANGRGAEIRAQSAKTDCARILKDFSAIRTCRAHIVKRERNF